jgi:hypothetical protein
MELTKWVFGARDMSYDDAMKYVMELPSGFVQNNKWLTSIVNSSSDHGVWTSARLVAKSYFLEEVK